MEKGGKRINTVQKKMYACAKMILIETVPEILGLEIKESCGGGKFTV
jgi:hypothetical protein